MAGNVLINGTKYEITAGKTLIGGTTYNISSGKTLINGTAYDITFMPTFAKLFSSVDSFDRWGQSSSTTAVYPGSSTNTYPEPDSSLPQPQVGDTWYLFYGVGPSLEISKIELLTSTTMNKTTLKTVTTETQYTSILNSSNTGIYGSSSTYASTFVYLHFTLSPQIVDKMFTEGNISIIKGYYSRTATNTTGNLGITSTMNQGILFSMFSNVSSTSSSATKTTLWGAMYGDVPHSPVIKGGTNASFYTDRIMLLYNNQYYMPSYDGSNLVRYTRGYTLAHFSESW